MEKKEMEEKLSNLKSENHSLPRRMSEFLEQAKSVYSNYIWGIPEEKRDLVKKVTSNRLVEGKKLVIELKSP
ncbi:MAG: hypothetical protein GWN01_01785, partial [Nitrosopumilaceae archaeon]|nr:hypothetical protein [Nitrosopumilaceae archaeon]NIU86095.1 hypothetical protein [Nitrosopumilaceae archaeon]NIV64841.1 hypothetical protein [Nitrosopumilaceae archaeon]NIX60306.1 hypothetical protein [Nitrosopumilaceae archaeon]